MFGSVPGRPVNPAGSSIRGVDGTEGRVVVVPVVVPVVDVVPVVPASGRVPVPPDVPVGLGLVGQSRTSPALEVAPVTAPKAVAGTTTIAPPGILQLIRAALAVQVKETIGQGVIDERERRIVQMVFDRLGNLPRVVLLAAQHRDRLPVFSFYIEGLHYNLVVRLLNDRFGIQARGGCSCAGTYGHYLLNVDPQQSNRITSLIDGGDVSEKPGWVRVSLHPIMSDQEIAFVCSAIADISRLGDTWSLDYERLPMVNDYRHESSSDEIQTIVSSWFGRFDGTVELSEAGQ